MTKQRHIRVGVGGWTYAPWRDHFYPARLPAKDELGYASRRLTAIEINATYYGTQSAKSFARWRDATPSDFVFSVKATRYATNRKVLAEAGDSVRRFIGSGIAELGPKLGPLVWQFLPSKRYDADDFEAFLALLPREVDGLTLRHVMDVRHESFMVENYLALAGRYGVATVYADSDDYPSFADLTADFVYARLMRTQSSLLTGYADADLDRWAERARLWAEGAEPDDLPRVAAVAAVMREARPLADKPRSRDVYIYFISGAKERAPAAAMALLERLGPQAG